jgi:hypothetical protein
VISCLAMGGIWTRVPRR